MRRTGSRWWLHAVIAAVRGWALLPGVLSSTLPVGTVSSGTQPRVSLVQRSGPSGPVVAVCSAGLVVAQLSGLLTTPVAVLLAAALADAGLPHATDAPRGATR